MSVLFISDLHLEAERPDITRAFLHFLEMQAAQADALYILGDFFEVWMGDDVMDAFQQHIADALRQLTASGVPVFIMHGNRDFLIGSRFCQYTGCTLLPEGSVIELYGERILLLHGDSLCTADESYQRLRCKLRHPFTRWLLTRLPLRTRQKLARKLRNASQQQTRMKAAEITDVTPTAVEASMKAVQVNTLIHGHTHRPAIHEWMLNQQTMRRIVLGDWDRHAWFFEYRAGGQFALEQIALNT